MINDALVNYYFGKQKLSISEKSLLGRVVSDTEYMSMLNKSGIDWTYEVVGEYFIDDMYNITVAVFIPGEMRMGLGTNHKEFGREYRIAAIAKAIGMACKQLRVGNMTSSNNSNPINNMVDSDPTNKGAGNNEPTTSNNNQSDNNNKKTEGDDSGSGTTQPSSSNGKPKFTQVQIDKMNAFKANYDIETDEQLINYIKTWNKDITTKGQLTPINIDSFLEWIDKMDNSGI